MGNSHDRMIQDIRKRCRLAMDGIISSNMRAYGLEYKLNFGIPVLKIKEIASHYTPNKVMAEKLWQDSTRELKILATLLYPKDEFKEDVAWRWVREIPNQEIREQLGMNLFRCLQYTYTFGMECTENEDAKIRTSGYWFLGRHIVECGFNDKIDYNKMPYIWSDLISDDISLHNAAKLFLKNVGRVSAMNANEILKKLLLFKDSDDPLKKEVFFGLVFDFQFYHGNVITQIEFV